jgi:hypothetical protein
MRQAGGLRGARGGEQAGDGVSARLASITTRIELVAAQRRGGRVVSHHFFLVAPPLAAVTKWWQRFILNPDYGR